MASDIDWAAVAAQGGPIAVLVGLLGLGAYFLLPKITEFLNAVHQRKLESGGDAAAGFRRLWDQVYEAKCEELREKANELTLEQERARELAHAIAESKQENQRLRSELEAARARVAELEQQVRDLLRDLQTEKNRTTDIMDRAWLRHVRPDPPDTLEGYPAPPPTSEAERETRDTPRVPSTWIHGGEDEEGEPA